MKPFISFDGADTNGVRAEVHVQMGEGVVTGIENLDNDKPNVQVIIQSSHAAVKKPIKGWLQRNDPLFQKVVEAKNSGQTVAYRTESQRKRDVDRALPIGPLRSTTDDAQKNCISIFAGMDGLLSTEAVTNPGEDPAPGGRNSANTPGAQTAPAPATGGSTGISVDQALKAVGDARQSSLPEGVVHAAMAQALALGASVAQVQTAGFSAQAQQAAPAQQSAFATEAASWKMHNTDGRINLGSYVVQAMFGAERFAYGLIEAQNATGVAEDEQPEPVELAQASALAEVIVGLADRVQVGAYGGGRADRNAPSHTRARALVFDAIETRHPVPFGAEPEVRTQWSDDLVTECIERFRHLASLAVRQPVVPAQPADEAPAEQASASEPAVAQPATEQPAESQASVTAIDNAPSAQQATAKPKPIVEGEEGFVAPDEAIIGRFAALAAAAGFEPVPDSPIVAYLHNRFGVKLARQINAANLDTLVSWYEAKGDGAGKVFRDHVLAASATEEAS